MSRKTARIAALIGTLAAVGVTTVAASPALALNDGATFENWVVSGSLTPKTLNEPVTLPAGSTFNGSAQVEYGNMFENLTGTVKGDVSVPPFEASLKLLGLVPTTVGVTFSEVGPSEGTIVTAPAADCPGTSGFFPCVNVSVLTTVNVGITTLGTSLQGAGISVGASASTACKTSEPISFHLNTQLTLINLLIDGPQFTGTTKIPPMTCEGPEGILHAPILSAVMSGPENAYELEITRPGLTRPKSTGPTEPTS
jgi:hypothetical protein